MPQSDSYRSKISRDTLLASLRETHAAKKPLPVARAEPSLSDITSYDFADHAAYSEVRVAKAASQTLGVKSPFFRVAEAVRDCELKIGGTWVKNFASYDYLGLNLSKEVRGAVEGAVADWGVSATASRLVGGERRLHADLEQRISGFLGTQSALVMVSGHATNMALLGTLVGPGDLVLVDALAHNSIYEGIRNSGAQHATFPHNDHGWVEGHLAANRGKFKNALVVIEGLYSMDGDAPDLRKFVEIKARHECWLMVDEAHSVGVLGATGRGICEEQGIDPAQIEVIMGTLSKSFCSCGGFVAGSEALIDLIRYRAPGFVYSVGLSAPNTAAAMAAVDMIAAEPERVQKLREIGQAFRSVAVEHGLDPGESQGFAVCPIIIGDSLKAVWMSNRLLDLGFNVLPIIAPAVPDKSARLRFFLTAAHDMDDISAVLAETAKLRERSKSMTLTDMASG